MNYEKSNSCYIGLLITNWTIADTVKTAFFGATRNGLVRAWKSIWASVPLDISARECLKKVESKIPSVPFYFSCHLWLITLITCYISVLGWRYSPKVMRSYDRLMHWGRSGGHSPAGSRFSVTPCSLSKYITWTYTHTHTYMYMYVCVCILYNI